MVPRTRLRGPAVRAGGTRRLALAAALAGAWLVQGAWAAYSQQPKPPGPLTTARVRGDLHVIRGEGGNVAVYVTGEGVVLVDNMFHRNHADILAQVKTVTGQPLRYVINTHQHDDHAGGSFRMLPLAEVIAHRNVRANLTDLKQPYYEDTPGTPIGLPRVTFSDRLDLHLGATEVQAHYFGRGHTSGDAIVYFPALRTIHTGDLFLSVRRPAGRPPGVPIYVDYAQGGSVVEWSRTLERTLSLDFDTIIPGHGPLATRADLVAFNADLVAMRTRLAAMITGGSSRADVVRVLETDYGWRSTGCPPAPPTPGCLSISRWMRLSPSWGSRREGRAAEGASILRRGVSPPFARYPGSAAARYRASCGTVECQGGRRARTVHPQYRPPTRVS